MQVASGGISGGPCFEGVKASTGWDLAELEKAEMVLFLV